MYSGQRTSRSTSGSWIPTRIGRLATVMGESVSVTAPVRLRTAGTVSAEGGLPRMARVVFSSPTFLFFFLPAVLVAYWLIPRRARNALLFAASLVFYTWGAGVFVFG